MCIFWKYLIRSYLKIFFLSTFSFISVLFITKLKDIASFAAITYSFSKIIKYVIYQIPSILPIAIPISCLISSFILFQKLSHSNELTALRSCGLSFKKIISPIIIISILISFLNFFITSELTPFCRINSKKIYTYETTLNPISILKSHQMLKIKNAYIDTKFLDTNSIKNLMFIMPNKSTNRLTLFTAKKLKIKKNILICEKASLISHFARENSFDDLIIENQDIIKSNADNLSKYMKPKNFSLNPNYLSTKMLLVRDKIDKQLIKPKNYIFSKVEILRRISLAISALSFTLIGISFSIEIGKKRDKKKIFQASLLTLFILISFTIGKAFKYQYLIAYITYILPHLLTSMFSIFHLKKISGGIE